MVRKAIGHAPTGIGRALVKSNHDNRVRAKRQGRKSTVHLHNVDDDSLAAEQSKLKSVMERNAMDEFMAEAIMKEKSFAAQRANVIMVGGSTVVQVQSRAVTEQLEYENIRIPRRPQWKFGMDPDELIRQVRHHKSRYLRNMFTFRHNIILQPVFPCYLPLY
mgnify:CR=1 FL=1